MVELVFTCCPPIALRLIVFWFLFLSYCLQDEQIDLLWILNIPLNQTLISHIF